MEAFECGAVCPIPVNFSGGLPRSIQEEAELTHNTFFAKVRDCHAEIFAYINRNGFFRYLTGRAGAGKSVALLLAAAYARAKGYCTIYIPEAGSKLANPDRSAVATALLAQIKEQLRNREWIVDGHKIETHLTQQQTAEDSVMKFFNCLHLSPPPFFTVVIVDDWNAVQNWEERKHFLMVSVGYMGSEANTLKLYGTSSSFDPLEPFPDAHGITFQCEIKLPDEDEFRSDVEYYVREGWLPSGQNVFEALRTVTGTVPRLLSWAKMKYLTTEGNTDIEGILRHMRSEAKNYYCARVDRVFASTIKPRFSETKKMHLDVAAAVYVGGRVWHRDALWQSSGLFTGDLYGSLGAPVCAAARDAICDRMKNECTAVMRELTQTDLMKFRAVELMVVVHLRTEQKLRVVSDDVCGRPRDVWECSFSDTAYEDPHSAAVLTPGKLLICDPAHKAVDMVGLSSEGELVFIKVSQLLPSDIKYNELWRPYNTASSQTFMEHYISCIDACTFTVPARWKRAAAAPSAAVAATPMVKMPPGIRYVCITSSTKIMWRKTGGSGADMHVITGRHFPTVFGELWQSIQHNFDCSI